VTTGDRLIERGATRLQELSREMAARGGVAARFADEIAEDAAFLRKLKPSLILARARGEASTNQDPDATRVTPPAPSAPQLPKRPKPPGSGPNPFLVVGVALVAGIAFAKVIDWRGHAHPRDD